MQPLPLLSRAHVGIRGVASTSVTRKTGLTLIEMVTVIMLVAVLSVVVMPRFFVLQEFDARAFSDQLQTMLRYAQKIAIARRTPIYVRLNGASMALCLDATCSADQVIRAAAGGNSGNAATLNACGGNRTWACEATPAGVNYATSPNTNWFYFDSLGKPFDRANIALPQLKITVTTAGTPSNTIYVETETGYVHLESK